MLRTSGQDRFLVARNEIWYYWRRVPKTLVEIDIRAPIVRQSLKTDDLAKARAQRDILEKADNDLWAAMLLDGKDRPGTLEAYKAAKLLSESLGFSYRPADELALRPIDDIVRRVTAIMDTRTPIAVETAVLGGEKIPKIKVSEAFKIYCDEIVADEIAGKSPAQRKQWEKVKRRAIDSFIAVVEDKAMTDITRDDGRAFHKHWLSKVAPKAGGPRKSASPTPSTTAARRSLRRSPPSCVATTTSATRSRWHRCCSSRSSDPNPAAGWTSAPGATAFTPP
jgi:hypothetical protein